MFLLATIREQSTGPSICRAVVGFYTIVNYPPGYYTCVPAECLPIRTTPYMSVATAETAIRFGAIYTPAPDSPV